MDLSVGFGRDALDLRHGPVGLIVEPTGPAAGVEGRTLVGTVGTGPGRAKIAESWRVRLPLID
jgi:hypothetical protein